MLYEGFLIGSLLFNPVVIQNSNVNISNTLITSNIHDIEKLDTEIFSKIYLYVVNDTEDGIGDYGLTFSIILDDTQWKYGWNGNIDGGESCKFDYLSSSSVSGYVDGLYVSKEDGDAGTNFSIDKVYLAIPYTTSDSVVEGITDGIGLLSPITNEFLNAFTSIFWDSTANDGEGALTTFSSFALTFLGVSITFAVVKLALNLIRGKTGA